MQDLFESVFGNVETSFVSKKGLKLALPFEFVISREDYNFLTKVMKHRNALAHGFKTVDFDPTLVKELINTIKRLTQSTTETYLPHEVVEEV